MKDIDQLQLDDRVKDTSPKPGQVPGVFYVDPDVMTKYIDSAVQVMVKDSLKILMNDPAWVDKIQQLVTVDIVNRVSDKLSLVDINSLVADNLVVALDRYHSKIVENFSTAGILDTATQCELVISDGVVVAQSGLACKELLVEQSITTPDLRVHNLAVTGSVNTDCAAWTELANNIALAAEHKLGEEWKATLVQQVLELAKTQGIDFDSVTVAGAPVFEGNRLNSAITDTSIQKVGLLRDLSVLGPTHLARTVNIENHRVGINTESPDMALTIWDEEVSVSLGKIKKDRAWIGSSRQQTLDIGVNRRASITIEPDGLVVMDRVRLDRWQISFASSVPNHSGTRGDIVFNHDPKPGQPWAWQCLGGFRWQILGVS